MKKKFLVALIFTFLGLFSQKKQLKIGDLLPCCDAMSCANSGNTHKIGELIEDNGILFIFTCNICPFVLEWEKEYPILAKLAKEKKIGIVLINSNEAKRNSEDSPEEMKKHANEKGYGNLPYLIDANSVLANDLGASTTPHVFLFNKDNKLVYKGAIDDRYENKEKKVTNYYLKNAIIELSNNKPINLSETLNKGCIIKRL